MELEHAKIKKLNLGSGLKVLKGYVNVDLTKKYGAEIVYDLEKFPYPFKNNEFDEILMDNVLEHLDDTIKVMEELWRISKNGAKITIFVPLSPTYWGFLDPTHRQFFTFNTFDYFTKEHVLNYYSKARFKIVYRRIRFHPVLKIFEPLFNIHERVQKFYSIFLAGIIPPFMLKIILEVEK